MEGWREGGREKKRDEMTGSRKTKGIEPLSENERRRNVLGFMHVH